MVKSERAISQYSTETVWNAGLAGTGVAGHGRSLIVGYDGEWEPEYLALLAAESSFMTTLLALAREAGVEVLGYVSTGHLRAKAVNGEAPSIALTPCVVVASAADAACIGRLADNVARESIVAKLFGERLRFTLDVRAIPYGESR